MSKATYYNDLLQGKTFDVLKDHGDGTVDIGTGDVVVVGRVKVVAEAKPGHVTLGEKPVESDKSKETKKTK